MPEQPNNLGWDDLVSVVKERMPDHVAAAVLDRLQSGREQYEQNDGTQPILVASLVGLIGEAAEEVLDCIVYLNVWIARVGTGHPASATLTKVRDDLIRAYDGLLLASKQYSVG